MSEQKIQQNSAYPGRHRLAQMTKRNKQREDDLKHNKDKKRRPVESVEESSQGEELEGAFNTGFDFDVEADIALLLGDNILDNQKELKEQTKTPLEQAIEEHRCSVVQDKQEYEHDHQEDTLRERNGHIHDFSDVSSDSDTDGSGEASSAKDREYFDDSFQSIPRSHFKSFDSFDICKPLLKALSVMGLKVPTPIQQAAIPVAMMGRDICGGAETGSGKTAAFLVPILERLLRVVTRTSNKTRVLILLPTRELAVQCAEVATKLTQYSTTLVRIALAAGGLPMKQQAVELKSNPDIVIATPGRLIDHLTNTPGFHLDDIEILVLDEADRMLEEGFEAELQEIIEHCPESEQRQTMLFSATMTDDVGELARLSLKKPVRLFVDGQQAIAKKLEQEFIRVRNDKDGEEATTQTLSKFVDQRLALLLAVSERVVKDKKCIVFLPTKELTHRCLVLFKLSGLKTVELHGGMDQASRLHALATFKSNNVQYLLATDVAARGLDIPSVDCVLNYSMPANYNQYLHRVGRTARAGQGGLSITLVGEGDRKLLKAVLKNSTAPVKQRSIPPAVITAFRKRLEIMTPSLTDCLHREQQEKLIDKADREASRAMNLIDHASEIASRPKKQWFQSTKEKSKKRDGVQSSSTGDLLRIQKQKAVKKQKQSEKGDKIKAKRRVHRQSNGNDDD